MLFLALLGKPKGLAEIQTAKPDLIITPPPKTDNLDPVISMDVFEEMERKGFAAGGKVQGLNDGSRSRSLHQGMQAPSLWSNSDPVIIPTVKKRKFFRGLFLLLISYYISIFPKKNFI